MLAVVLLCWLSCCCAGYPVSVVAVLVLVPHVLFTSPLTLAAPQVRRRPRTAPRRRALLAGRRVTLRHRHVGSQGRPCRHGQGSGPPPLADGTHRAVGEAVGPCSAAATRCCLCHQHTPPRRDHLIAFPPAALTAPHTRTGRCRLFSRPVGTPPAPGAARRGPDTPSALR